jgi:PhnB protein
MDIPKQYLPIMPYLIVRNARAFLEFSKSVFSAKEQLIAAGEGDQIMHGEIRIHDAVIMFGDASDQWKEKSAAMYLYVEDVDEVYKNALNNKARSLDAPAKKDYGYTAGFEDPFGNHWFIVQAD